MKKLIFLLLISSTALADCDDNYIKAGGTVFYNPSGPPPQMLYYNFGTGSQAPRRQVIVEAPIWKDIPGPSFDATDLRAFEDQLFGKEARK